MRTLLPGLLMFILAIYGCDSDRLKLATDNQRLEKENQELKSEVAKSRSVADYDLQAKCSKDARSWFNEKWGRDKDTILLDYTNHYHKGLNRCFILVEYHYAYGGNGSWVNDMIAWDVYENSKFANFSELTTVYLKPTYHSEKSISTCEVWDKKCKTIDEFNDLVRAYLSN